MDPRNNWKGLLSLPLERHPRERGFRAAKDSQSLFQRLGLVETLDSHRGCVNTVVWNESGRLVLSGSDDHRLIITNPFNKEVVCDLMTSHRANIFSAKFLPGTSDRKIVSCAGDGTLLFTDLEKAAETHRCSFTCHSGTAYELLTVSGDPNSFLSCGEDGTVRWFDLRTKDHCGKPDCKEDILITLNNAVTSMSFNPLLPYYLAVGSSDAAVRIFDRRMLGSRPRGCWTALVSRFLLPEMEGKRRRITSIEYRPDGEEVLVSFSSDYIYTFDPRVDDPKRVKRLFVGRPPKGVHTSGRVRERSPPPLKRLRLRGDWSDTGPNARPENGPIEEEGARPSTGQQPNPDASGPTFLMQRMTDALSRMLNDPSTRLAMRSARSGTSSQASDSQATNVVVSTEASSEQVETNQTSETQVDEVQSRATESSQNSPTQEDPGTNPQPESLGATARSIDSIQESISNLRNQFIDRHKSEPTVNLRYSSQGLESSVISIQPSGLAEGRQIVRNQESGASTSLNESNQVEGQEERPDPAVTPDSPLVHQESEPEPIVTEATDGSQDPSPQNESRSVSPVIRNLPGPSQVVTHPGASGTNPVTGERQRRRGVSGPPTGTIEFPSGVSGLASVDPMSDDDEIEEFEIGEEDPDDDVDGRQVLQPERVMKFQGHRNARTMIKEATWWGNNTVISGSDCGHIFGWDRRTQKLVLLLEADRHVVNCVQPHPFDPILVSSGIDYNVKVWAPIKEMTDFDEESAMTLMNRNEIMLEETRDTITVPATLMIRMLASLNQIRRAGRLMPRNLERREPDIEEPRPPAEDQDDS